MKLDEWADVLWKTDLDDALLIEASEELNTMEGIHLGLKIARLLYERGVPCISVQRASLD